MHRVAASSLRRSSTSSVRSPLFTPSHSLALRMVSSEATSSVNFHRSVSFSDGSVTFRAENVLFKVPKSVLQQQSDVFASMLGFEDTSDEPIMLEDSSEAFQEFCEALYTPFESCLGFGEPDLARILDVLTIAHKYCATSIETRALYLVRQLTNPRTIRAHVSEKLPASRIMELAFSMGLDDIVIAAWDVVVEDFRAKRIAPVELLALAERMNNTRYIGEAYYQVMLRGRDVWATDPRLSDTQRQNLFQGTINCVNAWDALAKAWGAADTVPHQCMHNQHHGFHSCKDSDRGTLLDRVWQQHSRLALPSRDVLGKLDAVKGVLDLNGCGPGIHAYIRGERDRIVADLAAYYTAVPMAVM